MCDTEEIVINPPDEFEQFLSKRITKMQLSELRKSKGLSQKAMSELSGLSVQCISDIESFNSGNPTLKSIVKYLECLGYEIAFQKKTI
jgi:transcriptional regulator with XRE-family HTH domain